MLQGKIGEIEQSVAVFESIRGEFEKLSKWLEMLNEDKLDELQDELSVLQSRSDILEKQTKSIEDKKNSFRAEVNEQYEQRRM